MAHFTALSILERAEDLLRLQVRVRERGTVDRVGHRFIARGMRREEVETGILRVRCRRGNMSDYTGIPARKK